MKSNVVRADARAAQDRDQRSETSKARLEQAEFWFRRFILSLALANAGAFTLLGGGILQADDPGRLPAVLVDALECFLRGMMAAGVAPFLLWAQLIAIEIHVRWKGREPDITVYGLDDELAPPKTAPWHVQVKAAYRDMFFGTFFHVGAAIFVCTSAASLFWGLALSLAAARRMIG